MCSWICWKIILATVGVFIGLSAFVWFFVDYQNYNAAIWALLSGIVSAVTLHLHQLKARNLIDEWYDSAALGTMELTGVATAAVSVVAMGVNIALAIDGRETLDVKTYGASHIPAAIFALMSLRAGLFLIWAARKYKTYVLLCDPNYVFRHSSSQQRIPDLDFASINYM